MLAISQVFFLNLQKIQLLANIDNLLICRLKVRANKNTSKVDTSKHSQCWPTVTLDSWQLCQWHVMCHVSCVSEVSCVMTVVSVKFHVSRHSSYMSVTLDRFSNAKFVVTVWPMTSADLATDTVFFKKRVPQGAFVIIKVGPRGGAMPFFVTPLYLTLCVMANNDIILVIL